MINSLGITNKVKINLIHYILWSDVNSLALQISTTNTTFYVLRGSNPISSTLEYVLPIFKQTKLTLETLDLIFNSIKKEELLPTIPEKILLAIVDIDGTVVYYYVYPGVNKPKHS